MASHFICKLHFCSFSVCEKYGCCIKCEITHHIGHSHPCNTCIQCVESEEIKQLYVRYTFYRYIIYNICKGIMHLLASRAWKFFTATFKCIYNESFTDWCSCFCRACKRGWRLNTENGCDSEVRLWELVTNRKTKAVFASWTEHEAVTGWSLPRMTLRHGQGHLRPKQHHCIVASVLSLASFCTPPPLCVSTKEEANGTGTVSRVLMVEVNAICLWWPCYSFASSRITCLLPKTKQLRCSFHSRTLYIMFCVCQLFCFFCLLWFSVCSMPGDCRKNELWMSKWFPHRCSEGHCVVVVRWSACMGSCLSDCLILEGIAIQYMYKVVGQGILWDQLCLCFSPDSIPTPPFLSLLPSLCLPPFLPLSLSLLPSALSSLSLLFSSLPLVFVLLSPSLHFSQLLNISFLCIHAHTWGDHCDIARYDWCSSHVRV